MARRRAHARGWSWTQIASYLFTALAVATMLGFLALFVWHSLPVWRQAGTGYVTTGDWSYRHQRFGAAAMIYGTAVVAAIAVLVAAPLGIGAAVGTAEVLPTRLRTPVKMLIELLAGIPSVVYGLIGILLLRGVVFTTLNGVGLEPASGDSLLTAGLLLAVMILPTIMTLADDALRGVPGSQRTAARGLGLGRGETVLRVAVPQAWPGLVAAVLLGLGRALGETIAVFLVVGRQDGQLPANLFTLRPWIEAGQTLTSKLGGAEINIAWGDPLHWAAVVGLGLLLLLGAGTVTLAGAVCGRRGRRG